MDAQKSGRHLAALLLKKISVSQILPKKKHRYVSNVMHFYRSLKLLVVRTDSVAESDTIVCFKGKGIYRSLSDMNSREKQFTDF